MKIFKHQYGSSLKFAVAALILALAAPSIAARQRANGGTRGSVNEDLSQGASFTFKIAPNLPEFTFKVVPEALKDDENGNALSIVRDVEVFSGNSTQLMQHLEGCKWADMQPPRDSEWFTADDFNFDGYQDIFAMTVWGATGNEAGCIWIFDPKTERFTYSREFSELSIRKLDPDSKTILSFWSGGGGTFNAHKYKIEKNRPVLFWSENKTWNSERMQFHCVAEEVLQTGMVHVLLDEWGKPSYEGGPCDPADFFEPKKFIPPPARDNQAIADKGPSDSEVTTPSPGPMKLNEQGINLMKAGNYDAASGKFTEAALLSPTAAYANNAGFAFYKMKKYESAVYWFKQAVDLDSGRPVAYLNLGDAYVQLSRVPDAREAYTRYLDLAPNSKSTPEVKKKLESLSHAR